MVKLTKLTFCVGTMLAKVVQQTMGQVNKVLTPVTDVIGPDSFLRRPVPATEYVSNMHRHLGRG